MGMEYAKDTRYTRAGRHAGTMLIAGCGRDRGTSMHVQSLEHKVTHIAHATKMYMLPGVRTACASQDMAVVIRSLKNTLVGITYSAGKPHHARHWADVKRALTAMVSMPFVHHQACDVKRRPGASHHTISDQMYERCAQFLLIYHQLAPASSKCIEKNELKRWRYVHLLKQKVFGTVPTICEPQ